MQVSNKFKVTFENCSVNDEVIYKPISRIATILCKSHNHKDICCISCEGITAWVPYEDLEISTIRDKKNKERKEKGKKKKLFGFIPLGKALSFLLISLLSIMLCSCQVKQKDNYGYKNLNAETSILIQVETVDDLIDKTNEGTHYIFLGWTACKWCQYYIPLFNHALSQNGVEELTYFSPYEIKGYKYIQDELGNNIDAAYKSSEYKKMIEWIHKDDPTLEKGFLQNYNIKVNEEKTISLPWLYAPKIYKIVDGKIIGVVTTLNEHGTNSDGSVAELTENQKEEVYNNIKNLIKLTA